MDRGDSMSEELGQYLRETRIKKDIRLRIFKRLLR